MGFFRNRKRMRLQLAASEMRGKLKAFHQVLTCLNADGRGNCELALLLRDDIVQRERRLSAIEATLKAT